MPRTLYVLVYPSRLFAAHWAFWLPHIDAGEQQADVGDRVHVTGDRLNGFEYEYHRDYNVREDDRHPNVFPIGLLSDFHLTEESKGQGPRSSGEGQRCPDDAALNAFDEACREVPAPGPGLNQVKRADGGTMTRSPPKRAEVRDCQWWIKETVSHLVRTGILLPLDDDCGGVTPASRVDNLPKH